MSRFSLGLQTLMILLLIPFITMLISGCSPTRPISEDVNPVTGSIVRPKASIAENQSHSLSQHIVTIINRNTQVVCLGLVYNSQTLITTYECGSGHASRITLLAQPFYSENEDDEIAISQVIRDELNQEIAVIKLSEALPSQFKSIGIISPYKIASIFNYSNALVLMSLKSTSKKIDSIRFPSIDSREVLVKNNKLYATYDCQEQLLGPLVIERDGKLEALGLSQMHQLRKFKEKECSPEPLINLSNHKEWIESITR